MQKKVRKPSVLSQVLEEYEHLDEYEKKPMLVVGRYIPSPDRILRDYLHKERPQLRLLAEQSSAQALVRL